VIAEGVENSSQLSAVKSLDCESAQGFYFSRPVPGDEAATLILSQTGW